MFPSCLCKAILLLMLLPWGWGRGGQSTRGLLMCEVTAASEEQLDWLPNWPCFAQGVGRQTPELPSNLICIISPDLDPHHKTPCFLLYPQNVFHYTPVAVAYSWISFQMSATVSILPLQRTTEQWLCCTQVLHSLFAKGKVKLP